MKRLVNILFKWTLFIIIKQSFTGRSQEGTKYIIQKSKSIFHSILENRFDYIDFYHRQISLYIIRYLRGLLSKSISMKLKRRDKKPKLIKNPEKIIFTRHTILVE